jgi:CheY-like chemotaxis protein
MSENKAKKIAVVKENQKLRLAIRRAIMELGFPSPTLFPNGTSLIRWMAKGEDFDVILMDYDLPEMDGIEAARMIRKRRFGIKIVVISEFDLVRQRAWANGFHFLKRPFIKAGLAEVLNSCFEELESVNDSIPV